MQPIEFPLVCLWFSVEHKYNQKRIKERNNLLFGLPFHQPLSPRPRSAVFSARIPQPLFPKWYEVRAELMRAPRHIQQLLTSVKPQAEERKKTKR